MKRVKADSDTLKFLGKRKKHSDELKVQNVLARNELINGNQFTVLKFKKYF